MYCPECKKEKETRGIGVCSVCYRELKERIENLGVELKRLEGMVKEIREILRPHRGWTETTGRIEAVLLKLDDAKESSTNDRKGK